MERLAQLESMDESRSSAAAAQLARQQKEMERLWEQQAAGSTGPFQARWFREHAPAGCVSCPGGFTHARGAHVAAQRPTRRQPRLSPCLELFS